MTEYPSNITDTGDLNGQRGSSLVSVIIPTYNRAKYVRHAIDSVLGQTYPNYEIIVVDDGSTDNTREALKPYVNRIKYIYQEHSGHSAARNTAIHASRGQWIAFLDSDDTWLPAKLSRQMEILNHSRAKVCFTNIIWNSEDREKSSENQLPCKKNNSGEQVFDEPFDLLLFESVHKVLVTLVVERDLLFRVGCFDERLNRHVDVRLCFRLAFEAPFAYVNQPLAVIDRRPGLQRVSTNCSFDFLKAAYCGNAITRSEAYLKSGGKSKRIVKALRHQLGHYISKMALCACAKNNNHASRRFALDGLYFGGGWRTYRRCIGVLICPWLVRWLRKSR